MTVAGTRDRMTKCQRYRATRRAIAAALLLVPLGACSPTDAAPEPRPTLIWADAQPSGELESDEWVKAVREAEFTRAWAANTADFSLPALTSVWDTDTIHDFAATVRSDLLRGTPHVYLGPRPLAPVAVAVDDDGKGAVVAACVDASDMRPPYDDGNDWPLLRYYPLELTESGTRRMARGRPPQEPFILPDGNELTHEYCKTLTIARAVFDPAPDLEALASKEMDDVVLPTSAPVRDP